MFELASKFKFRFDTPVGSLATEDLWDLPLEGAATSLDNLAKSLNKALKDDEEESFVATRKREDKVLRSKFSIVKHIIDAKILAADKAEKRAENKAKKEMILAIVAEKENDSLKGMSKKKLLDLVEALSED